MSAQQNQSQQSQSNRTKTQRDLSNLKGRMTRLENLVHAGHKLEDVLPAVTKLSVDEVRALLEVPADMELTLNVLAAGTVWKLGQLEDRVERTNRRVHTLEDRVSRLISALGYSETDEGGFVVTALVPALKAGSSGGEKSFIRTLRAKGVSDDEIRHALSILKQDGDGELELDDADMFGELYREFVSFRETTTERLDEHDEAIARNTRDLTRLVGTGEDGLNLPGRVNNLEASHREIRDKVAETPKTSPIPIIIGLVVGCVLGIIGGFAWANHDWGNGTHTATSTVHTKVGKASVTNVMHNHVPASHWWVAALFGVAILLIFTGLGALFAWSTRKTESVSETTTTSSTDSDTSHTAPGFRARLQRARARWQANRAERRQEAEEERAQGSHFLRGTNSDDPRDGETQVLPAAGEKENRRKAKVNA